jgi:hypothetical protein
MTEGASPAPRPVPVRITFEPGGTYVTVHGEFRSGEDADYVLHAVVGQMIELSALSSGDAVGVSIRGEDGTVLQGQELMSPIYRGTLPATQDYFVRVTGGEGATSFALNVIIPRRISFEPGATSAAIPGVLLPYRRDYYVVRAVTGQLMDASVQSAESGLQLGIYGADGTVLASGMGDAPFYRGVLPRTQDYVIWISSNTGVEYWLNMVIPRRIVFGGGETSVRIADSLAAQATHHYVVQAAAGQLLDLDVSGPVGALRVTIYGVDGTVLMSGMGESYGFVGTLPITQDYVVSVSANADVPEYGLEVVIPERVSFASGATSGEYRGRIAREGVHHYILGASANQTMSVDVISPGGDVYPAIYGLDGTVLKRASDGNPSWSGPLPSTQEYRIDVYAFTSDSDYSMEISITD